MTNVKLHIFDSGDLSVGIFGQEWTVECPFDIEYPEEEMEDFKSAIINVYKEYCNGRIRAIFDFETDKM